MKCGTCCHEIFDVDGHECPGAKRIPLYPEEVDKLVEVAKERGVNFKVLEDLVFPDLNNKKILVITYKIILDNETKGCPFYDKETGCTVHEIKPFACRAYPLSLKNIDAFNYELTIDPLCNFVIANREEIKEDVDMEKIKQIFINEYPKAEKFFKKNKKLMFKIRKLEAENKIKIARQISLEDFDKALKDWDREEITAGKE
jgi:Fe-S-cluster containining protein